jgi:hypothetical protein
MTLIEIFIILMVHYLADFVAQTDEQAKGKSKNWNDLLSHTFQYSLHWLAAGLILFLISPFDMKIIPNTIVFFFITFMCHTTTDYFTSRLNSKLWSEGKVHLFFVSIGFDQILHYMQLFLTYWFLAGKN